MSIYSHNQMAYTIIGDAVATETTFATFSTGASDKEVKILSADGTAPTVGKPFKVYQKAAAASGGFEFTDTVDPRYIERITVSTYLAETQKSVRVEGFTGTVPANTTFEVEVRLYNEGGSLSVENFAVIQGFYVTGPNVTGVTWTNVRDGLITSLQKNITSRGGDEFVLATTASPLGFTITGGVQTVVPGKNIATQIQFDVLAKSFSNQGDPLLISANTGLLTTTVLANNNPGRGTGKFVVNREWFDKGFTYDPARLGGWPADFPTPYYADPAGQYAVVDIKYFTPRNAVSVERQYKLITICLKAGVATVVADLETITGYDLNNPGTTLVGGLPGPQGPQGEPGA